MLHRIEYFVFQCFKYLVLLLPLKSAQRLGKLLGTIAFYLVASRRNVALDNLSRAFQEFTEKERIAIAKGAFRNYAIALVELLWFPNLDDSLLLNLVRFKNIELLFECFKRGKGIIMLTGHFGNWELGALATGWYCKQPITIVVQTQSNHRVDEIINRHRCLFGNRVVPMEKAPREILRTLSEGGIVALAADQSAAMESIYVEFFGRKVSTHQGPAVFALKSGAPMLMGVMQRSSDGTYEITLEEIPTADLAGYSEEHVIELTRRHTSLLEQYIRRLPDHWLWMHKRWKHTLKDNVELTSSAQRSVHV